jgi:hypothetical protein
MEGGRAPENGEVTTEDGQGLAQAVSRPLRIEVRPQERDQLLARLDLAWPHGQIGKQGLSFASPDGETMLPSAVLAWKEPSSARWKGFITSARRGLAALYHRARDCGRPPSQR